MRGPAARSSALLAGLLALATVAPAEETTDVGSESDAEFSEDTSDGVDASQPGDDSGAGTATEQN